MVHDFARALRPEDVPKPEPGDGEVVVEIEASGLCHTGIHASKGDRPVRPKLLQIPGHERVGIVESVGRGVTKVREGERVAIRTRFRGCAGPGPTGSSTSERKYSPARRAGRGGE